VVARAGYVRACLARTCVGERGGLHREVFLEKREFDPVGAGEEVDEGRRPLWPPALGIDTLASIPASLWTHLLY
jgi:hypothetical protein